MNEEIQVWITRYAITSGIGKAFGFPSKMGTGSFIKNPGSWKCETIRTKHWHKTEAEAVARAKEMRDKKIASLKKQIAKLEAMKFEPKG